MRTSRTLLICLFLFLCLLPSFWAYARKNSVPIANVIRQDSLSALPLDSTLQDTLSQDTLRKRKNPLQAVIDYKAADSMVLNANSMAYMYGNGEVKYEDIQLNAAVIQMSLDSNLVYAVGVKDSLGDESGLPIFKDPSGEYNSRTLRYSFASQKGYITDVVTQQGEGFLTGGRSKKMPGNALYMVDGKYTTCDNHDCPHFYLQLTKARVEPKKNIVFGPAYMVLGGVPLPLAIPFGFFPFTSKYSSGVIMPTFGDEMNRGFYARNGGYYFAINDFMDLALTGEIYTKGSWGLSVQSNYIKRYKYSGSFAISYIETVTGDKGMPDYSKMKNFRLSGSHTQDTKANPNMTLSASINFTTSGYDRNDLNSYYNPNQFTENTKSSSINLSYRFPDSPWSISSTANITQRTKDSTIALSLPDFTFNMSRIYPFKRKAVVGKERWYEKISMNYTGTFRNSITSKQDVIMQKSLVKDWSNGMQHSIPISATFNLFKYINLSPSISLNDKMYTSKVMRQWDTQNAREVQDTLYGFYNVFNYNVSLSAQTKLYGFYKPLPFLGDKVEMIRHVFTPSVSLSAAPDFGSSRYPYWKSYSYVDQNGKTVNKEYSPFSGGIYGTSSRGKQGVVSMNFTNNLEMKVKSDQDTTGVRKISLIENLSAGISYNMAADSMRWSNINASILIKLTKSFNLQMSGTFDTYTYGLNSAGNPVHVNVPRWEAGRGLGRLSSTGTSFSYTFNNDTFKKKDKTKKNKQTEEDDFNDDQTDLNPPLGQQLGVQNNRGKAKSKVGKEGYLEWNIPWSLSINYSINMGYGEFNKKRMEYDYKFTQNLSFSGNISPTKNWSFNFSASYDFDTKKIAYMNCSINRDLHCWQMGASFVPVGPYKSYNFNISVKSSLLKDLKYDKRASPYDRVQWY